MQMDDSSLMIVNQRDYSVLVANQRTNTFNKENKILYNKKIAKKCLHLMRHQF